MKRESIDWSAAQNKQLVFSRVRDTREIGRICPYLTRRSNIPRGHRKNMRAANLLTDVQSSVRRKNVATRNDDILSRDRTGAVSGISFAIFSDPRRNRRDLSRWVFGGMSEQISVNLDLALCSSQYMDDQQTCWTVALFPQVFFPLLCNFVTH